MYYGATALCNTPSVIVIVPPSTALIQLATEQSSAT